MNFLFYDDSPVFGGHEVMTLLGVEALLQESSPSVIRFLATHANTVLQEKLANLKSRYPALEIEVIPEVSSKLEALKNRLSSGRVDGLAARLKAHHPDLVIAVQGNIEHSSLALLAAKKAGLRSASYIPVPHSNTEMGAKGGAIRDLFTGYLFRTPDVFVTITDEMGAMLRARGATCPIKVVYNGVDTSRFIPADRAAARIALGLPLEPAIFGMVGRLELKQKQQHLLVEAVAADPELRKSCHLVFAGDGPDSEALGAMIEANGLTSQVTRLPWCDPAGLYPALDALIIPSRYEGLPLVMLETLATGTAVLGSDRDGMRDVLPAEWRFRPNDVSSLAATLRAYLASGRAAPEPELVERVRTTMSLPAFSEAFRSTLVAIASPA